MSRPENHLPNICYPYPSWIVELILPSQILLPLLPKLFAAFYCWRIKQLTRKDVGCFILNGFFASLAPYMTREANKIGLSHGSDLDVWANTEDANNLAESFKSRSLFKYLPNMVSKTLIKFIVDKQYLGYVGLDAVFYFPLGLNSDGDKVLSQLISQGVRYVPRYDFSFEPLLGQSREFKNPSGKLELFSGVRFLFKTFPERNRGYNKGNDIIIEGIAKYFSINQNIRVHFFEKGEDWQHAKELCKRLGLERVVVWHKEIPLKDLLTVYQNSDICFDQVGTHWIGAIGGYALWLGKPLIANTESVVQSGVWPNDNPVCSASTAAEVCDWLVKLQDIKLRKDISEKSKKFVEDHMDPSQTLKLLFDLK